MNTPNTLTILPPFCARIDPATERLTLTKKFISGMTEYCKRWDGPVQVVIEEGAGGDDLDQVAVAVKELPFAVHLAAYTPANVRRFAEQSAVVLLAAHYHQTPLGEICAQIGVPAVYTTECTLRTRLQIANAQRTHPLVRARRFLWQWQEEQRQRHAIRRAAGVQCNGTPTYEAYQAINRDPLLYFDSRVTATMLASEENIQSRLAHRNATGTMRLAFSGRLVPIKGADHLVRVAAELRNLGTKFTLTICGGGALEQPMRRDVAAKDLADVVLFRNTLDFETELMPFMRQHVDLFVCCHRQGDPSCTYLETMACGVPIIGYANEAFRGLAARSGAGWSVPMNQPLALARRIAELSGRSEELQVHSVRSLAFAREHTFDQTFAARIAHLRQVARGKKVGRASTPLTAKI